MVALILADRAIDETGDAAKNNEMASKVARQDDAAEALEMAAARITALATDLTKP